MYQVVYAPADEVGPGGEAKVLITVGSPEAGIRDLGDPPADKKDGAASSCSVSGDEAAGLLLFPLLALLRRRRSA